MSKVLLATTFRLRDIRSVSGFLRKWKADKNISLMVLIESSEYSSKLEARKMLASLVDEIVLYNSISDNTRTNLLEKNPPSLLNIIEALKHKSSGYDYVGYANSDIQLISHKRDQDLSEEIHKLSRGMRAVFAHRKDYSDDHSIFSDYMQGLDLFMFPSQLIRTMRLSPALRMFRIGQVGWDYMLPLSLPKQHVTTTCALPLYHKTHKTGSNADWSRAVLCFLPYIDTSWTDGRPFGRAVLVCARFLQGLLRNLRLPQYTQAMLADGFDYFGSRIIFYSVIERVLLRAR